MAVASEILNIFVGICIIISTYLCYYFQIKNFLKNKSAKGVSFFSFLVCNCTSYMNFISGIIQNYGRVAKCGDNIFDCLNALTTVFLLFSLWICYLIIMCLYFFYFLRENTPRKRHEAALRNKDLEKESLLANEIKNENVVVDEENEEENEEENSKKEPEKITSKFTIFYTIIFYFLLIGFVLIVGAYTIITFPEFGVHFFFSPTLFAKILSYTSSFLVIVQWTPQILVTLINRGAGNFSLVMLIIMIIGAVVNVTFFIVAGQDFSIWLPYCVSLVQQLILFVLIIIFEGRNTIKKIFEKLKSSRENSKKGFEKLED